MYNCRPIVSFKVLMLIQIDRTIRLLLLLLFFGSKNDISEQIVDRTDLPSDLIRKVSGEIVLEQTQPKV